MSGDARSCVLIWRACGTSWASSPAWACGGEWQVVGGRSSKFNSANDALFPRSRVEHCQRLFDPFSSPSSQPDSAMAKSIVAMVVVVALAMTKMPTFSHPFANLDVRMLASLSRQGPQQKSFPSPSHSGSRLTASSMPWPQKSKSQGSRHSESS